MFRAVTDELVKTLSTEKTTLGLGQTVVAASSLNEAAHVKIGTFVIKKNPSWFWQSTSYQYLSPLRVCFDESNSSEELLVLEQINKSVDLTTGSSASLSTLNTLGLSGLSKERYQIDCDLGPVIRQELAVPAIKNYRVPAAVVRELNQTSGKKALAVVMKVFVAQNAATINLVTKTQGEGSASASVREAAEAEASGEDKKKSNKSFTMVKGQALAYCVQEVYFDSTTNTFELPTCCDDDQENPDHNDSFDLASPGNADKTNA